MSNAALAKTCVQSRAPRPGGSRSGRAPRRREQARAGRGGMCTAARRSSTADAAPTDETSGTCGTRRVQLVRRDGRDVSTLYGREGGVEGGACAASAPVRARGGGSQGARSARGGF